MGRAEPPRGAEPTPHARREVGGRQSYVRQRRVSGLGSDSRSGSGPRLVGQAPSPTPPPRSRRYTRSEGHRADAEGRTEQGHMASPFLPAGATTGDSGGELSSGDESGDVESLQSPETEASGSLAELFEKAAEHLQDLVQVASREQLLYLYARYKQVKSQGRGGGGSATGGLLFPPQANSNGEV